MASDKELTRIERELVLQYLRDDNVPLTVTLEDKPEQSEKSLEQNKVESSASEKIPVSAIFPVAIPSKQIEVLDQGIILLKNQERTVQPFLGKTVRIQFYLNRLGLYFITTMKECSKGLAIVVPAQIFRVPDLVEKKDFDFYAELSFASEEGNSVVYDCVPLNNYMLFTQPKWADIEEDRQHQAKALLESYVEEVKTGKTNPVGNGVQLISIVRYLTEKKYFMAESVKDRVKPFNIIYVDDKRIVVATKEYSSSDSALNFQENAQFNLSMSFTLSSNKLLKRRVELNCSVEKEYFLSSDENVKCFSLQFEKLKEEDLRFIYERINGKKLS